MSHPKVVYITITKCCATCKYRKGVYYCHYWGMPVSPEYLCAFCEDVRGSTSRTVDIEKARQSQM